MATRRSDDVFMRELTQLLCAQGISSLTIADLAQRMRCSRRRLYAIAASKEDIFVHVCHAVLVASVEKGFAAARGQTDPVQAISAYLHATLNTSGLSKAALLDLDAIEQGKAMFDAYQTARIRGLESMIAQGVKQGVLAPHNPRLVSEAVLGAAFRLRNPQFLEQTGMRIGDAFSEFYAILLNGLLIKQDSPSSKKARTR